MINTVKTLNKFVDKAGVKDADNIITKLAEDKVIISLAMAKLVMRGQNRTVECVS